MLPGSIEIGFGDALRVIEVRRPVKIELCLHRDSFGGFCLRGRLVYLVLVFRRSDADEHGAPADPISFRKVAHSAVLTAYLLERNDISRNSECQWNFRVRRDYRREAQASVARTPLVIYSLSLYSLRGLIQRLIRATAGHDQHECKCYDCRSHVYSSPIARRKSAREL